MIAKKDKKTETSILHIVDVLASINRDQVIMKLDKAKELINILDNKTILDKNVVFFDPFCKAGEILLAAALVSLERNKKTKIVGLGEIKKAIHKNNRFFGLSLDDRHYRMSMRTFYGNKGYEHGELSLERSLKKGNIGKGSYLDERTGELNETKFKKELKIMLEYIKSKSGNKKIIAIGNPPYNEGKKNIYQKILDILSEEESIDEHLFVIPARWFSGGQGLKSFRLYNLNLQNIKYIKYFNNHLEVFPKASIRGGICILHRDKSFSGKCKLIHSQEGQKENFDISKYKNQDTIVPHFGAHSIIDKVNKITSSFYSSETSNEDTCIYSMNIFRIPTNYFDNENNKDQGRNAIPCLFKGGKYKNILKNKVSSQEKINLWKVIVPKANGGGEKYRYKVLPKPEHFIILDKGKVCTHTFVCLRGFKTKQEAEYFLSYLRTKLVRFLIGIRKPTQDISQKNFYFVPVMTLNKLWTDERIFKHFKITKSEKKYIEDKLKYWT